MLMDNLVYSDNWSTINSTIPEPEQADLVLLFGDSDVIKSAKIFNQLKDIYSNADIVGSSSAGNILGSKIYDSPIIATAIKFEKGFIKTSTVDFSPGEDIAEISRRLISQLPQKDLRHIFMLSDGLNVNGSALLRGINEVTKHVSVSGGMAGDGDRFQETWVVANEPAKQYRIVTIGFYGDDFIISTGCFAGWSEFGGERTVTKSSDNVLYELDNLPALELYKTYLGKYADELPHSGMRFPLSIKSNEGEPEVIRTLLAINEEDNSITFAGDIPQGYIVRLMKPKINILIDGAKSAAKEINIVNSQPALGLVVSCTGRKIVMDDLVEEELEVLEEVLGENVQLTGFYSYGEFAPFRDNIYSCELHNQTMTLTAVYEA